MFKRKLIALAIVAIMAVSMLPVTALANFTMEGGTIYIETKRTTVTVPTAAAHQFWLDPQGLLGVPVGGTATPGQLADFEGKIYFATGFAPEIISLASVPMDVGAVVQVVGDASATSNTAFSGTQTQLEMTINYNVNNLFVSPILATGTGITNQAEAIKESTRSSFATDFSATATLTNIVASPTGYHDLWFTEAAFEFYNDNATSAELGSTLELLIENGNFDPNKYKFDIHPTEPALRGTNYKMEGLLNVASGTEIWEPFKSGEKTIGLDFKFSVRESTRTSFPGDAARPNQALVSFVTTGELFTPEEPVGPTVTLGFTTGAGLSNVSNAPFTPPGRDPMAGGARFTFAFGNGNGRIIPFAFGDYDLDQVFFGFQGDPTLSDATAGFTRVANGVRFDGWNETPAGTYELVILLSRGDPKEFSTWHVTLVIT